MNPQKGKGRPGYMLDDDVIQTIEQLSSRYRAIFPKHLLAFLDRAVCERTLRSVMARLASEGKIQRLGARSGYLACLR